MAAGCGALHTGMCVQRDVTAMAPAHAKNVTWYVGVGEAGAGAGTVQDPPRAWWGFSSPVPSPVPENSQCGGLLGASLGLVVAGFYLGGGGADG